MHWTWVHSHHNCSSDRTHHTHPDKKKSQQNSSAAAHKPLSPPSNNVHEITLLTDTTSRLWLCHCSASGVAARPRRPISRKNNATNRSLRKTGPFLSAFIEMFLPESAVVMRGIMERNDEETSLHSFIRMIGLEKLSSSLVSHLLQKVRLFFVKFPTASCEQIKEIKEIGRLLCNSQ
jgi:hypothetical protein